MLVSVSLSEWARVLPFNCKICDLDNLQSSLCDSVRRVAIHSCVHNHLVTLDVCVCLLRVNEKATNESEFKFKFDSPA